MSSSSSAGSPSSSSNQKGRRPSAIIIIPGYASDASLYIPLQTSLRARGLPCWIAPISAMMWIPTFGGRYAGR